MKLNKYGARGLLLVRTRLLSLYVGLLSTLGVALWAPNMAMAENELLTLESSRQPALLLELYSSHGCSSCPPAQQWLSQFKQRPELWQHIIPVVFHVDYWDYIGWRDPFADKAFSSRQRQYKARGQVNSVYTPGFVVNGREWTGWFQGRGISAQHRSKQPVGILTAALSKQELAVTFAPESIIDPSARYTLNLAILGFDLQTWVTRGENARKTLVDDFVVLGFKQVPFEPKQPVSYPDLSASASRYAVAVWLSSPTTHRPVQAVAGYLPSDWQF